MASTETASRLGDAAWHDLLAELNYSARRDLERFRGREVQTPGDGLLAVFDGATRAVRCALALVDGARALGLSVRVGVHTGEYEQVGAEIRGIAVHVASRVMASAGGDEVRVSGATASLVELDDVDLRPLGPHQLKGVARPVDLVAVERRGA